MSEQKIPIPAMLYNAAVGGHVTNSQQIIDEDYNLEQKDINKETLGVPYNASNPNGMGKIVLKKNDNFKQIVEAQTDGNTIFVIKYDFTLTDNVTVPANCVLEFYGGSLNGNYTLTLNKTYIQGNAKFDVTLAGDVSNEVFNVLWMKGNDIGEQINKAGENFKSLIIPQGSYTFTTPIVLSGIRYLQSLANLTYNGTKKNCEGIFLIKSSSAEIYFQSLYPSSSLNIDYSDSRTINLVGLEIRNCNDCNIIIGSIAYFNENLRITGNANEDGVGQCSNNTWHLKSIHNGNFNVRIYQEGGGYCNEQNFIGGHLANYTSAISYGRKYYFGIGGPAIDLDSYLPVKPSDSYDSVNAIKIVDMNLETAGSAANLTPAFLFRNTRKLSLVRNRYEGQESSSRGNKAIGSFELVEYVVSYDNILSYIDFSEATSVNYSGFNWINKVDIIKTRTANGYNVPYFCNIADDISANGMKDSVVSIGYIVDTSSIKRFKFNANGRGRFVIYYLNDDNVNITPSHTTKNPNFGSYNSNFKGFVNGSDLSGGLAIIPSEINRVFVGVSNQLKGNITEMYLDASQDYLLPYKPSLRGASSSRPIGLPAQVSYFDTTLNKPIWYNGNGTTGWCDATGTPV